MKKIVAAFTAFIFVILGLLTFKYKGDFSSIITLGVFSILILSYFYFEKSKLATKEIAPIATLSTIGALGRVAFAPFPNIKPTTFIVAISGLIFGPYEGFLIGSTSAFISNIFLGQGPWTIWQMFSWGLVGFISGVIGKKNKNISAEGFSVICFIFAFMFDWIMNLWYVIGFIKPLALKSIFIAYLSGLTFDLAHAASSFVFCIIFFQQFYRVLDRFKKRLEITYIKNEL
ncbi:ECF transporter S component [Clostridium pasteurianum]|uniref:Putative membrane protein n=1 Tax=Clostridium pasteurianum BC1 TaxID=86416 RepID=R4K7F4_CLOPA|nr:ECF transporter S component [Clostridium pasteurianum]AGK98493.1 putative membrane protein [Clostridium pasteurianum BC1]